jgi:hypothetical protein
MASNLTSYHVAYDGSQQWNSSGSDKGKERQRSRLDILLDSECLYLKGTGSDVTPAILSGQVVFILTESTTVKGINLHFMGKAILPKTEHWYLCLID